MRQRSRHTIVYAFILALLAGCAGEAVRPAGPTVLYPAPSASVQLAQNQDETGDDSGFEDLFPGDEEGALEEDYDPFETVNRFIFAFNEALDVLILQPAAATYRFLLPEFARDSVRNVIRNLKAPVIFVNELWQGKDDEASETLARFGINSTLGLAGLIDVADSFGYVYHSEDFGQTLGVYGAQPGPYLVLPLFGPSSVRDAIGRGVDSLIDPWSYVLNAADVEEDTEILLTRRALGGIDTRARNIETVEELKRDSVDFYARVRSLYLQLRRSKIKDGKDE
jgi:phospholipid-binding lipoprotein MlaA